ncbi:DUF2164 domain-containing protein [Deefgea salmonis]|uniref:DUF2164 domain-containing protein n=1 Tax=Deefgea salmonis TaxID=2875502 RepID=A0ABS8BH03_9NEIS|nr:DUF2164 domain-containing protein [Deefgea salmonis]MCB5194988.1 DUF2164 domain-containing protein [Deefgea salmonis]
MSIKIDKSLQPQLQQAIQRYCREEIDTDIGELQAAFMLDFVLREIGPHIYNQAIRDAQNHLAQQVEALPEYCFEVTTSYWHKKK